jgi:hypothetical protein
MVTYYCCGCRAQYLAQPKRCPRCKGRSFAGVSDDAPTLALLDADAAPLVTEPVAGELAEAFAASERFRLQALGMRVPEPPPVVVLEGDDNAPPTPRDMPEH